MNQIIGRGSACPRFCAGDGRCHLRLHWLAAVYIATPAGSGAWQCASDGTLRQNYLRKARSGGGVGASRVAGGVCSTSRTLTRVVRDLADGRAVQVKYEGVQTRHISIYLVL